MKTHRLAIAILIAFVLSASIAPAVAAKENWINLRTKSFNIVSNADEGETRELAIKLEQFRYVFSKLFNISAAERVPVTVAVFKSDGSFKPFKPLYNGKPANIAGYFQRGEDENIIALNINGNELRPMAVIYHEYTHLLTAYTRRPWPLWLIEGLAEVYSSFEVKKNQVTLGAPVSSHVYYLREHKFIPLQTLFSVNHFSPAYNERDKQGVFYAQSWALAHYLMFGDKTARQPQLVQFIKLIEGGAGMEQAFSEAFKTDFATMEKELRRYIGKSSYDVTVYTLKDTEGDKTIEARPLTEAEALFYLGNLLLHARRIDEAENYFKQAAALDPDLARPYEGLGFVAKRRTTHKEAKEHFKQAIARGSKNHLVRYYYAELLHSDAVRHGPEGMAPEVSKIIVEELKTAIKLMPGFAPSYRLLGSVYLSTGENLEEGARALKTALRLEPQNKRPLLTLAQIQVRLEDYAAAKKTLEPLLAPDAEMGLKNAAQSMMEMIGSYTTESPESKEGKQPPALKPKEGPTLKFEGTETMRGVLAAMECEGAGIVLAFKSESKLLRFAVTDPVKLQFFSRDPQFKPDIKCGPINLTAVIHFKPMAKGNFAGDAIAVEFKK